MIYLNKKIIAPIIIGAVLCLYFLFVFFYVIPIVELNLISIAISLIGGIMLIALTLYVVKQRLDEIKGGEEDDISKY